MPEFFPDNPMMFVGHNFDSRPRLRPFVSKERGGEAQSLFLWRNLLAYLSHAGLEPGEASSPTL